LQEEWHGVPNCPYVTAEAVVKTAKLDNMPHVQIEGKQTEHVSELKY